MLIAVIGAGHMLSKCNYVETGTIATDYAGKIIPEYESIAH
jgi:hypothetical protein